MDYEELRLLTFEAVKRMVNADSIQPIIIINNVARLAQDKQLEITQEDKKRVIHAYNELLIEGVLAWGKDESNALPPFMSITDYGKQVLESGKIMPYDPDGYLNYLHSQVPNVDDIIITYIAESLQTFRRNNILSAAVMLGVASERAFDLLFDAVLNACTGPKKEKLEKLQDSINIKQKFDKVKEIIMQIRNKLSHELEENLDSDLDGIFNLIRVTRNDAGHPTSKTIRRDHVFNCLILFVSYCKCVYGLIDYLKNNVV